MTLSRTILSGWNVLVVDDEPDSLEIAQRVLRHYGANVATAENGRRALESLAEFRPRFIISDISMPEVDGWALIYALQQDPRWNDTPVIALTAHAMSGDRERAVAAGFYNYLTKPLTPRTFIHDLLRLLVDIPEFASELQQGVA